MAEITLRKPVLHPATGKSRNAWNKKRNRHYGCLPNRWCKFARLFKL